MNQYKYLAKKLKYASATERAILLGTLTDSQIAEVKLYEKQNKQVHLVVAEKGNTKINKLVEIIKKQNKQVQDKMVRKTENK